MSNAPYAEALGDRDPAEVMRTTPAKLADYLSSLSPAQLNQPTAPGKWSLREVMCHIADCEIAWSWRMRLVYEKDNPTITPFDQDPWARIYSAYTFEQAEATFNALRAWNNAFIAGLSPEDKQRPATHPERGEITLWTIVQGAAGHDCHHLAALEKLLG